MPPNPPIIRIIFKTLAPPNPPIIIIIFKTLAPPNPPIVRIIFKTLAFGSTELFLKKSMPLLSFNLKFYVTDEKIQYYLVFKWNLLSKFPLDKRKGGK